MINTTTGSATKVGVSNIGHAGIRGLTGFEGKLYGSGTNNNLLQLIEIDISNGTGILVKPRKPYELSQGIINLLQNKKLYKTLAFNAYNNAKKYDWNKEISKIEKIFLKVVTKWKAQY